MGFDDGNKGDIIGIDKGGKSYFHAIENIYYVNCLKHNLLSISQMCNRGNHILFTSTVCIITSLNSRNLVLKGKRHKNFTKMILSLLLKMN